MEGRSEMEPSSVISRTFTRRAFLAGIAATAALPVLAACQPTIQKEIVEVEKEVTRIVEQPVEIEIEKEVIVEKEVVVVATPDMTRSQIVFQNRGGDPDLAAAIGIAAAYNVRYPEREVKIDHTTGDHSQHLQLQIAAGRAPDVFFDASLRTGGILWDKGIIQSLEDFLKKDFNPADHIKEMWISMVYDGHRIALPWDSGSFALFVNKKLFAEAGVELPPQDRKMTYEETLEKAIALTVDLNGKHPGESGHDPTRPKQYGYQPVVYIGVPNFVYSRGGEVIDAAGRAQFQDAASIEGWQRAANWSLKDHVSPSPLYVSEGIGFQFGNIAMREGGVWGLGSNNDTLGDDWMACPIPAADKPNSIGWYSGQSMTTQSKNKDDAWHWMNWVSLSQEGERTLASFGLLQPTRHDNLERWRNSSDPPGAESRQVFVNELDSENIRWPGDHQQSFWLKYGQYAINAWRPRNDALIRGKVEYQDVAAEWEKTFQTILDTGQPIKE
jgi:multiple sugar transport system substrate-binding protein